ncbi:MAG: (deoxy)nucleoside triphosphate pyrophosphohydrolase [Bacteroidaceae bacterium]|nr:(deoxy)nucleoside triphosphate pyrophosphohydrolase [Bacteroidaceae bacterium]
MKHYNVVCAVVVHEGKILCMRRPKKGSPSTAGKWEFPGGKTEVGEQPEDALRRELREEMDYEVKVGKLITTVEYQYPDFSITLQAFLCSADNTTFNRKEHIDHRWCQPHELPKLDWAAADEELIEMLVGGGHKWE